MSTTMIRNLGFALLSSSANPLPSTRIACLNLFPYLRQSGIEPHVLFSPTNAHHVPDVGNLVGKALARGVEAVVFQKIHGPAVLEAVSRLRAAGVRTIYCVCDIVDNQMAAAADATIVVTDYLKTLYAPELQKRIYVVHDGIERPDVMASHADGSQLGRRPLKAALVTAIDLYRIPVLGVAPRGWRVEVIGRFPRRTERIGQYLICVASDGVLPNLPASFLPGASIDGRHIKVYIVPPRTCVNRAASLAA